VVLGCILLGWLVRGRVVPFFEILPVEWSH
jgi:hypothetical protein